MNVKQVAIAVSLFLAGTAAMAVEATQWNPPTGDQSRSEVKAELRQAAANGELQARDEAYGGFHYADPRKSTVTRAEVKQELARARANGELEERGETYGNFTVPHPHAPARALAFGKSKTDEHALAKHDAR